MRIFLTGGTGFVGGEILRQLSAAGHNVWVLVRPDSPAGSGSLPKEAETAAGNILDSDLSKHLEGVDCVVHLVGIIRDQPKKGITFQKLHVDATKNIIRAMQTAGIKRLVHMSALGSDMGDTPYFTTKREAELVVKESGLEWTVFKPSVIYGSGDEFVNALAKQVKMMPIVPVIGDGEYRLHPVSVSVVAEGFVKACTMPETIGKAYEVGGPRQLSYNQLLDDIAEVLGKGKARKIHFPLGLMMPMIRIMENFPFFPITSAQLKMLLMNNVCDPRPFTETFKIEQHDFKESISEYLK